MVREQITESVKLVSLLFYSSDEARDTSIMEQSALVVRFFDETSCCIQECFISFNSMVLLDAAIITNVILCSQEQLV